MALPNSHYSWVYQTLWGLKYFLVSFGTKRILEPTLGWFSTSWQSQFLGLNGPYLLLHLEDIGPTGSLYGNVCEIIVDGTTITPPTEGAFDGLLVHSDENAVGRDGTWQPFILATKTLEIKMRAKYDGYGGDVAAKIMRFGT